MPNRRLNMSLSLTVTGVTMFDIVRGHPTAIKSDEKFGYDAQGKRIFALDEVRNILDLNTREKTGQSLIPTSLLNTPGYEVDGQ
jgi:hypothetical protein